MVSLVAKSYELTDGKCYVDGVLQSGTESCKDVVNVLLGIGGTLLVIAIIVGIATFVLWLIMLIHAIKHEEIANRALWIVILVAGFLLGFGWLVALVYYFAIARPLKLSGSPTKPTEATVVPSKKSQPKDTSKR